MPLAAASGRQRTSGSCGIYNSRTGSAIAITQRRQKDAFERVGCVKVFEMVDLDLVLLSIRKRRTVSGLSDWQVCSVEVSSSLYPFDNALRQNLADQDMEMLKQMTPNPGPETGGARGDADRFGGAPEPKKVKKVKARSTPKFISRPHYCDHMAKPCMHALDTGKICARTVYYRYETFDNYCMMEYVNCREEFELWQMIHGGACFVIDVGREYLMYAYHDDAFFDDYYVLEDKANAKLYP